MLSAKKGHVCRTSYLYSRSDFLIGAGSIAALMGNYYRFNSLDTSRGDPDARALYSDWCVVGGDFRRALKSFRVSNKKIKSIGENA